MKRRRNQTSEARPNHERWVISYADFMTLLLAFFIVMFATANADKGKAKVVSEAVKAAFSQGSDSAVREAVREAAQKFDPNAARSAVAELSGYQTLLKQSLKREIDQKEVEVHMEKRGLVISFKQAALFDSGQAIVKLTGIPTMQKVAAVISKLPNQIRLEGHTDNIPIHNDLFKNNWELSSARSIAILNQLSDKFGVDAKRLSVSGYADVAPIASNDTEEGRMKNRRVDVVVVSSAASWSEPGKDSSVFVQ